MFEMENEICFDCYGSLSFFGDEYVCNDCGMSFTEEECRKILNKDDDDFFEPMY